VAKSHFELPTGLIGQEEMPSMQEKLVRNLSGAGFFTPCGTEEIYEVEYNLDEYQFSIRDDPSYGPSYGADAKTEWRGSIYPLPTAVPVPSPEHRLKLEDGTVLNCLVKADSTVHCKRVTE
jgi:hypothetical protein